MTIAFDGEVRKDQGFKEQDRRRPVRRPSSAYGPARIMLIMTQQLREALRT